MTIEKHPDISTPAREDERLLVPKDDVTWHSLLEFCHTHIGCLDTEHRSWRLDQEIAIGPDGRPIRPDLPETFQRFLDERTRFGIHEGLQNMQALVTELGVGRALASTPTILVGGTNGKGTVATALADALSTIHHRSGLYTSPHVERFLERIRISGGDPDRQSLEAACDTVHAAVLRLDAKGIHPTYFETATALAFEVFQRTAASPWILEVGLGGRWDATNVASPLASVITNVGDDHADRLGPTLEARAIEKAGIMRPGVPCFTAAQGEALRILRRIALDRGVPLIPVLPRSPMVDAETANLALVRTVIGHPAVHRRLRNVARLDPLTVRLPALPGRFERYELPEGRTVVLDVAHNTDALDQLARHWDAHVAVWHPPRSHALIGQLDDKGDLEQAWRRLLSGRFASVSVTRPDSERARPASKLVEALSDEAAPPATWNLGVVDDDPRAALQTTLEGLRPREHLLIAGSFYLASALRPSLEALRRHAR